MKVGTIKETKVEEYRVALAPTGVSALMEAGHEVLIERGAGEGSGFADAEYEVAGATVVSHPEDVVSTVDFLVKVKEPTEDEFALLRPDLILFSFLSLPTNPGLARALLDSKLNAIAYESVAQPDGTRPILVPMSRIAGRMAAEIAAQYLKKPGPGRGKLSGGIDTATPARAVVVGAGSAGREAADVLSALGAFVTLVVRDPAKVTVPGVDIAPSSALESRLAGADILIGAVHVDSGIAPKLVTREMVRSMGAGAVIVDIGIDQGGICETSRPTSHSDPIYVEEGVVHYCVPNMPGAVPRTSTEALTAVTLPYVLRLADGGLEALKTDSGLASGATTINGKLVAAHVAEALAMEHTPLGEALAGTPDR